MNKYLKYFLVVLLTLVLITIFTPIFGIVYVNLFGNLGGGMDSLNWGNFWNILVGLFISYVLFIPLIVAVFVIKSIKYFLILALVGLPLLFIILSSNLLTGIQLVLPFIGIALVGWLIGEGILLAYNKLKK